MIIKIPILLIGTKDTRVITMEIGCLLHYKIEQIVDAFWLYFLKFVFRFLALASVDVLRGVSPTKQGYVGLVMRAVRHVLVQDKILV